MSTASKPPASKSARIDSKADPYRYGWRYVRVRRSDGKVDFEQVPLTPDDVLHPQVDDFIVHSNSHGNDLSYLKAVFRARLDAKPGALVLSDCRVNWNIPGVRPLGPDVALFFGVKRYRGYDVPTFDVAAEKARPALVVEVTSRYTRKNDLGIKVNYYQRAGVPLYVIADAQGLEKKRRVKLLGYRLVNGLYQEIAPDARGRIYLDPVGVWLGVSREYPGGTIQLACFDPDTDQQIGDYSVISQELSKAHGRAAAESKARAEADRARAEAEARAEAQHLRAAAEAQARAEAEKRIRDLEAELKRSRRRKP